MRFWIKIHYAWEFDFKKSSKKRGHKVIFLPLIEFWKEKKNELPICYLHYVRFDFTRNKKFSELIQKVKIKREWTKNKEQRTRTKVTWNICLKNWRGWAFSLFADVIGTWICIIHQTKGHQIHEKSCKKWQSYGL